MATVYSYLRFSRPEQMHGDSQRRQAEKTKAWVAQSKLTLDESLDLRDLSVSAFRGKNAKEGALSHFLAAIDSGRVKPGDYLVLENLDRLSRDDVFTKALPLVQQIIGRGVSIVTLDPERVYSPTTVKEIGPLLEMLLSLFLANEESRKKSERLSQSWANKRAAAGSKKLTAQCPQWLRLSADRATFEPIPERVEVVRRVFRMAAGGAGYVAITKRLNAETIPPFGNGNGKHRTSVGKPLNEPPGKSWSPNSSGSAGLRITMMPIAPS
ncbi:MAG: recombinase family protein [Rhodospirillales bacterium]|nr:recombinase family protein [Rhodospirillales bacterium]